MHALLRRILTLTAPIVSALLLLTACGSSSINTGTAVTPTPTTQQVVQPTDIPTPVPHFKVGQTVQVGNIWQITIKSVKLTNGGQYDSAPAAGNTYLVISVS